ncbi:MAG TPA: hypothetical protein VEK73_15050, partial [Xanthobacteraceae bacterium]|nr:hypothetical protein [Xanthobacteraceae bacterium]
ELVRHAGRKLIAAAACAADALLRDGAAGLHAAPDKVAAFFDKTAAGFLAAIEGLHKRAALMEAAALEARDITPGRPRPADPLAGAIAAWADTSPRLRGEVGSRSDPGEGASLRVELVETPPHPDPLPEGHPATLASRGPRCGERGAARRARPE